MSETDKLQKYQAYLEEPWSRLFYELIWRQAEENMEQISCEKENETKLCGQKCSGLKILDFGSGYGKTADHFAKNHHVTAIDPNEEMLRDSYRTNVYRKMSGSVERLREFEDHSFDVILCHNVLEYVTDRETVLAEFARLIKPEGFVSVVKHNKLGKVMQKAVFEYRIEDATRLLGKDNLVSEQFGEIREYEDAQLEEYSSGRLAIQRVYGVRTFFGLQRNELKTGDWFDTMLPLEEKVSRIPEFANIAFSHHVILKPV